MLTAAAPDRIEAIATRSAVCLDGFPSGARFMARTFIPGSPILDVDAIITCARTARQSFYMTV
jgi:hypothetical protein